jgi:hypothetical protein
MFKKIAIASAFALIVMGCSSGAGQNAASNFLATVCSNGQTILAQLPSVGLTPAQVQNIQMVACSTAFGSTAAPATAPGQAPVFPPVAAPAPTVVPAPAPVPASSAPPAPVATPAASPAVAK